MAANAALGIYEFFSYKHDERIRNSLDFAQRYQQAYLSQAHISLLNFWLDKPLTSLNNVPGGREVIDTLAMEHMFPADRPSKVQNLVILIDYFDTLASCIKAEICDSDIANQHLAADARNFYCLYQAPIAKLKTDNAMTNFGNVLKATFVNKAGCDAS